MCADVAREACNMRNASVARLSSKSCVNSYTTGSKYFAPFNDQTAEPPDNWILSATIKGVLPQI